MKSENNGWNFGDSFPSIEIDSNYWQTLNGFEKLQYLKKLVFQEKDFGNRINLINFILTKSAKVGRGLTKNPEIRGLFDVAENSANFISILAAVGNILKAKQTHTAIKNNEIAKLMGFPNGNCVSEGKLDITGAMAEAFLDISDYNKQRFGLTIDNLSSDDKKQSNASGNDEKSTSMFKTIKATGTIDGDSKWGLIIKTSALPDDDDEDTTNSCVCKFYYPNSGTRVYADILRDKLQKIMYSLYIDKVDTTRNFVKIKGTKLEICERKDIEYNIVNVNVDRIVQGIKKVLDNNTRRAISFIGEPGTGKTIAVHKITNEFLDKLVFWVTPDSINTVSGIRNVFKILKMFEGSITVLDDIDSGPFTGKDEVTGAFIEHLDGTNNNDFKGFIICTVNDPSKLHASLINRPERIDEVILVKNPQSIDEITDILYTKAELFGYYGPEEAEDMKEYESYAGVIDIDVNSDEYIGFVNKILESAFTQAQVSGLINYCDTYIPSDNIIKLELLEQAYETRIDSISNANKIAVKGGKLSDSSGLSAEAMANLGKKSKG
jgi:hypothetical protein